MARAFFEFYSHALKREITIHVLFPMEEIDEAQKGKNKLPVLYLLHGGANDVTTFERYTSVERYIVENKIVAVLFSAENKYYRDITVEVPQHPSGLYLFHEAFFMFLQEELPAFITSHFYVSTRWEDTYIAGFSMGGYGAAYHALMYPEKYCALGLFSPLIFERSYCFLPSHERQKLSTKNCRNALLPELLELISINKEKKKAWPQIYLTNGTKDIMEFVPVFEQELSLAGAQVTTDYSLPYAHEWGLWDINLKNFLKWIPRTDYFA